MLLYDQHIEDEESKNMLKGQSEIRIIWLMMLIIIAVSAWFLDAHVLTYLCGLAFVMSVMHYVDAIQNPMLDIAQSMRLPSTHLVLRISVGDGVCQRFRVLPALVLSGILLRVEYQRIRLT
jgi:ABC-type multidrug transport system fused ATPase/permease subunit